MDTLYDIDPTAHPELLRQAGRASTILEDVLGQSASLSRAEWFTVEDQGPTGPRTLVRLRLKDPFSGSAEMDLAPTEFGSPEHLRNRFHRFWGDLLRKDSYESLERLDRLMSETAKD